MTTTKNALETIVKKYDLFIIIKRKNLATEGLKIESGRI